MSGRRGRDVLVEVLADEGVRHLFGNPGTTELPLLDELSAHPELGYVLGLQENTVVGMADGYAQATGRPAVVNLHTMSGLGGGLGNLTNAAANRTPLVVTAGQQDRRHLRTDPMLSGDLVGLARPVSKWQHEVGAVDDLGPILRRAFRDSASPPSGPVFVSIPMDVLDEPADLALPRRSVVLPAGPAPGLDECAQLLAGAGPSKVALVVGEEVASERCLRRAVAVAETLGCDVYGTPFYGRLVFPTDHPLWQGMLDGTATASRATLARYRIVFFVGTQVGFVYQYSPGPAIPEGVDVVHLSADPSRVARTYPTRLGLVGDIEASLAELAAHLTTTVSPSLVAAGLRDARTVAGTRHRAEDRLAEDRYDRVPMHPMAAVHALLRALPSETVVVDEAVTAGAYLRRFHRTATPGSYYFCRGGGLGWGMPASLGVKLAAPDRPVICVVGDGAAMYSIQSLWTAARYGLNVVFVVVNNRQYRILRESLAAAAGRSAETGRFVAMDLDEPAIDYVTLAAGLGVDGRRLEKTADIPNVIRAAIASERPMLIELPVRGAKRRPVGNSPARERQALQCS